MPFPSALTAVDLLLADEGKIEHAVELYSFVSRRPCVGTLRLFLDVAGNHIAGVAQERGQA